MKRLYLLLLLFVVIVNSAFSQNYLSGSVADTDGNPVAFANLVVYNGSEFVVGTVSDIEGNFKLQVSDNKLPDDCFLVASFVGMINDTIQKKDFFFSGKL